MNSSSNTNYCTSKHEECEQYKQQGDLKAYKKCISTYNTKCANGSMNAGSPNSDNTTQDHQAHGTITECKALGLC